MAPPGHSTCIVVLAVIAVVGQRLPVQVQRKLAAVGAFVVGKGPGRAAREAVDGESLLVRPRQFFDGHDVAVVVQKGHGRPSKARLDRVSVVYGDGVDGAAVFLEVYLPVGVLGDTVEIAVRGAGCPSRVRADPLVAVKGNLARVVQPVFVRTVRGARLSFA